MLLGKTIGENNSGSFHYLYRAMVQLDISFLGLMGEPTTHKIYISSSE